MKEVFFSCSVSYTEVSLGWKVADVHFLSAP